MRLFLFIQLQFMVYMAYSQVISGHVFNAQTGEKLDSAKIEGQNIKAITNINGYFQISNTSDIRISKSGFDTLFLNIKPNQTNLIINLFPSFDLKLKQVDIVSIRPKLNEPYAIYIHSKTQIDKYNFGLDMPLILQQVPSVISSSDAGNGIGYTAIRMRGIDPSRINVTINNVPINDAESHSVYWVNMPDLASSTQDILIQRGVGSSTNGPGAFGGSININTLIPDKKFLKLSMSFGSFSSVLGQINASTGLLKNGNYMISRISYIQSNGFIDRANTNLKSYFIDIGKKKKNYWIKFVSFGGKERTYQAWNGIPQPKFEKNQLLLNQYITDLGYDSAEAIRLINDNYKTYNAFTYKNQNDNYQQYHFQLLLQKTFSKQFTLQSILHSTLGKGYFEEFNTYDIMPNYGLPNLIIDNDTLLYVNTIRERWLKNGLLGFISNAIYIKHKHTIKAGLNINMYQGKHYGILTKTNPSFGDFLYTYYKNTSVKWDHSSFIKWNYSFSKLQDIFIDLQYRYINYTFQVPFDFLKNTPFENKTKIYHFINPKLGWQNQINKFNSIGLSLAKGSREPSRSDFNTNIDAKPEHVWDAELIFKHIKKRYLMEFVLYSMQYQNQLIPDGGINDVGTNTKINLTKSKRNGIEWIYQFQILEKLNISGSIAYLNSKINKIYKTDYNTDSGKYITQMFENTTTALSPHWICSSNIRYQILQDLSITLNSKAVSKQYLDNFENNNSRLKAYFINDILINYKSELNRKQTLSMGLMINNIANIDYAPTGYTFFIPQNLKEGKNYNFVYPQAGINLMLRLSFDF